VPLNSSKNDQYFSLDSLNNGFLTSNREGTLSDNPDAVCCTDIYVFKSISKTPKDTLPYKLIEAYVELPLVPVSKVDEACGTGTKDADLNIADFAAVNNIPLAANTQRTKIVPANGNLSDAATVFQRQVATRADIAIAGDWSVVLSTGVISVFKSTVGNITAGDYQFNYYHYATNATTVSKFASATGNLIAGDEVTFDANSNYVLADATSLNMTGGPTGTAGTNAQILDARKRIVGMVLEREVVGGKDLLDRVKTRHNPALPSTATGLLPGYLGQADQFAGSATGGAPENVHWTGAADTVVRIQLVNR